ncbi:hypothetical protein [Pseudomonas entomophila]|uniref:DUF4376 domain-containing protein n=1 Tax=Pseudomonas entomophila TaxID=312306 RepID=UPI001F0081CC|nr:hypothetical protein [Pseudomonas entomophila]MCG8295787.1 hypothetical protein [Pseudomonas entomophila]
MQKIVYQTNTQGLYVGQTMATPCPLEADVWLIPGGCVEQAPPEIPEHKAAHWNGQAWHLVDYFQGLVVYSITNGSPRTITGIGPIPAGYTLKKPHANQTWSNGDWVDDTVAVLARLNQDKLAEISSGCTQHIEGGYICAALGEQHRYACTLEDQINLTSLVFSGLDGFLSCTGVDGTRHYLAHSREQLLQVNKDLVQFKQATLQHADQLKRELAAAYQNQQAKAMLAITWTIPA